MRLTLHPQSPFPTACRRHAFYILLFGFVLCTKRCSNAFGVGCSTATTRQIISGGRQAPSILQLKLPHLTF